MKLPAGACAPATQFRPSGTVPPLVRHGRFRPGSLRRSVAARPRMPSTVRFIARAMSPIC